MEARPKIKINLSQFDKVLETIGIVLLFLMWAIALLHYFKSPGIVPIHFTLSGQPDGFGNKLILLLLPAIPTILYFGLTKLNKYPHIFNYPVTLTEENTKRQYTMATRLIRILKVSIVLIFTIDILSSFLVTLGIFKGLGLWFIPIAILLLAVPTVHLVIQSFRNNKKVN